MRTIFRNTLAELKAIDPANLEFGDIGIVTNDTDTDLNGQYRLAWRVSSGLKSDDNNWVRTSAINRVFLPADVVNSANNTLADVTGLSFAVTAGRRYRFKAFIVYTAAATTTGSRWTVNGPAITSLSYRSEYSLTTTTRTTNDGLGAHQLPAAANATSVAADNIAIVEGVFVPSASGTLAIQNASEVDTSAITAKANVSWLEWEEI